VRCRGDRNVSTDQQTAADLADDMDSLRHMLGAAVGSSKKQWGSRNYYATEPDDQSMVRLEKLGLVRRGCPIPGGMVYFHATSLGCTIAGLDGKQKARALE
jgi:hypothetical protein